MNIEETIRIRRSVRTFSPDAEIEEGKIEALRKKCEEAASPFGGRFAIHLEKFDLKGEFKPSTYGTIKGAEWYFLMGIGEGIKSELSAGYAFEKIVLEATAMGLGTCWIGGTFKKTDFQSAMEFPDEEKLRIVCPLGYPKEKLAFREKLMRKIAGSDNRKPLGEMFFEGDFTTPVGENNKFYRCFEMMRLAPSAVNSQPWRALSDSDSVWFYYEKKSQYAVIDIGISLAHFDLTLEEEGMKGEWLFPEDAPERKDWNFVAKFSLH